MQFNITGLDISVEETLSLRPKPSFFSAADNGEFICFPSNDQTILTKEPEAKRES